MAAFTQGIQGSDLAAGAAISVFLIPVLVVIAYFMLRVANRAEVV
jgi:multiple sugar transport system permease protein